MPAAAAARWVQAARCLWGTRYGLKPAYRPLQLRPSGQKRAGDGPSPHADDGVIDDAYPVGAPAAAGNVTQRKAVGGTDWSEWD